jgi:hypothetical protein
MAASSVVGNESESSRGGGVGASDGLTKARFVTPACDDGHVDRLCLHCGAPLPPKVTEADRERARRVGGLLPVEGRRRRYCSDAHRQRAFRRRKAGIALDAFPTGAARGAIEEAGRDAAVRQAKRNLASALLRTRSVYERRGLRTVGER